MFPWITSLRKNWSQLSQKAQAAYVILVAISIFFVVTGTLIVMVYVLPHPESQLPTESATYDWQPLLPIDCPDAAFIAPDGSCSCKVTNQNTCNEHIICYQVNN